MEHQQDEVVLDDGTMPRTLKVQNLLNGIDAVRRAYERCRGSKNICYATAVGELIKAFGSLAVNLIYDEEFKYFLIKLADGRIMLYNTMSRQYKVVSLEELINAVIKQ